jgi:HlyD family secretion protein
MTANVSIFVKEAKNALLIPNAALRFLPSDAGPPSEYKGDGVWVLQDEKPQRIEVKVGISDGRFIQLLSGLKEGDEVIVEALSPPQSSFMGPRLF